MTNETKITLLIVLVLSLTVCALSVALIIKTSNQCTLPDVMAAFENTLEGFQFEVVE